ncbi:MAG: hypothetical protein GY948_08085 [Alphaproteobacteria bacterium]|nr:hypothetical protein [Alphaproteobacteria bacterium]
MKRYSKSRLAHLSAELKACGTACRAISRALGDYYVLREQVRVCRKKG